MGLRNPMLDGLVIAEDQTECLEYMDGLDCLTEGVEEEFIVLPEEVSGLLTEALDSNGLDNAMRRLQKLYGTNWSVGGRTRKELVNMVRDQRFINHHAHLNALIHGGTRSDGTTFSGSGGIRWGGLTSKGNQVLMRTMGSFEYGPSQNIYQQTINFANFDKIIGSKDLDWPDKARLLLRDRMKVHCDCKAYRFYYAYTANKKGFALYPEIRPANIRNPRNKGGICKHLHMVLQWLGAHNAALASELKQYHVKKTTKRKT